MKMEDVMSKMATASPVNAGHMQAKTGHQPRSTDVPSSTLPMAERNVSLG